VNCALSRHFRIQAQGDEVERVTRTKGVCVSQIPEREWQPKELL
jgi:hypothetical protein